MKSRTGWLLVAVHFIFSVIILSAEFSYAAHHANGGWWIMLLMVADCVAFIPALILNILIAATLHIFGIDSGKNVQVQIFALVPGIIIFGSMQWYGIGYFFDKFISYLRATPVRRRRSFWIALVVTSLVVSAVVIEKTGLRKNWIEMNGYKHLVLVGEVESATVTYFGVHRNVINGEPNMKYISLYYDCAPNGGAREEVWPANAPIYNKGDLISIICDPNSRGGNERTPNRSTLHNIKIQGLLKKYRPNLLVSGKSEL